jgi:site-specific DNA recombinase
MSNRATLYLRSSKDRSDVSIDAQRRALHELAAARGLVVVDEFADAVESGKDDDRPAFQRLLHALKAPVRAFEVVLAHDTSRIARRRTLALIFEQECTRRGVRVVYKTVPDTDPITEMLLKSILQAMDEWHSLTSKAKGLAGMAENIRQGWRAGGRAPRGYQLEYHATGAVRDGAPVLKSKLVPDPATAPTVAAYLRLRAAGVSRGQAIARLALPWPASSLHSLDWNALTYAGCTVWNMHAEREAGAAVGGDKRRPRGEWVIQPGTHEPLIDRAEADTILRQCEATAGTARRARGGPLLLAGLVVAPDGRPWHGDGDGAYRLGKGKRVAAPLLESAVLDRLALDLAGEGAVRALLKNLQAADADPVSARTLAGLEQRLATLSAQIGRTVDLAAAAEDPTPVLRRVHALELERAELVSQLDDLRQRQRRQHQARAIGPDEVRALLRRLFGQIRTATADDTLRAEARLAIAEVVERVELDPESRRCRVLYALDTGDKVASPRTAGVSPALCRWAGDAFEVRRRA